MKSLGMTAAVVSAAAGSDAFENLELQELEAKASNMMKDNFYGWVDNNERMQIALKTTAVTVGGAHCGKKARFSWAWSWQ